MLKVGIKVERLMYSTDEEALNELESFNLDCDNGESSGGVRFDDPDLFGLSTDRALVEVARECIRRYGVGSCGPRGFYGTTNEHLCLENDAACALGAEAGIMYSDDLAMRMSVVACFCKPCDVVVCRPDVGDGLRTGLELARCAVKWVDTCDPVALRHAVAGADKQRGRGDQKCWIVVEGVGARDAAAAPLAEIVELKREYDVRVILDDSGGVGVLGDSGMGSCEEQGVAAADIDLIMFSLSAGLGSNGGVCVGARDLTNFQTINSAAFCFSAACPPYLPRVASAALAMIRNDGKKRAALRRNVRVLTGVLRQAEGWGWTLLCHPHSGVMFLLPPPSDAPRMHTEIMLQHVVQRLRPAIHILRVKFNCRLDPLPSPRLQLFVPAGLDAVTVAEAGQSVVAALKDTGVRPML